MRGRSNYHPSGNYDNLRIDNQYGRPLSQHHPYKSYYRPTNPYPYPYQTQTPFQHYAKPNQPEHWPEFMQNQPSFYEQENPSIQSAFLSQFQDTKGQLDFEKMLSTVNQLAHTVQQVSPVIKQVSSVIKTFR